MQRADLIDRIWERDPTVWTGGDEAKWLGWLDEPRRMRERVDEITAFADEVADEGLDAVVLLGMGGSSLAPEVLRRTFRAESLHVLDTTHPEAIRALEQSIDLEHTLFVSSSKSGSTLETRSHTDYFWEKVGKKGGCFVAITDPGSELELLGRERSFRRVVSGEPTIGGRYSALSPFGVVPAALMGIQIDRMLGNAERMAEACRRDDGNPGYELGRRLGAGWQEGRDKICIAETEGGFGLWAEQLLAESTGKQGKGLVPAPGESPDGPDRQDVQPQIADPYALGGEFFRWEFLAGKGANPQRCLWASTSTKNPAYRDVLYVEELIGPHTVDTMPEETIRAFQDHGEVRGDTVAEGLDEAHDVFTRLERVGVDYDDVTETLELEGVQKFAASFGELLEGVRSKRGQLATA